MSRGGAPAITPRYKLTLLTWLAIYPTITLVLWVFEPLGVLGLPLPLRTLILTAIVVPVMVLVLMPALTRLFARWLQAKPGPDR